MNNNRNSINIAKGNLHASIIKNITNLNAKKKNLNEKNRIYKAIFEQSPLGVAFCNSSGEIIDANIMFAKILGRSVDELKQLGWKNITHPEDINKDEENFEKYKAGITKTYTTVKRYIKPDSSIVWVNLTLTPLVVENGKRINLSMLEDITERVQVEEKITRKFQVLIQESNDVFEIIKPDGTIVYVSNASEKVIGYIPEERIGRCIYDYHKGEELIKIKKMFDCVLCHQNKKAEGSVAFTTKTGKIVYLEVYMQNLLDEPGIDGIVVSFRDITKRIEMEKQMAHISTHDELTGLPNNIYFRKKLRLHCSHAKKTKTKFALMMLDITGFKYINDTLGYQIGELIIHKVAKKLREHLNEKHFLCRYSGDRFIIIVQNADTVDQYKRVAKGIIDLFSKNTKISKYEVYINLSIGISIYDDDKNIDNIIKRSEMALFWAKKQGKNRYKFYTSDINIQNYKQSEIRKDLSNALKNEQLRVHYQPIINIETNKILAAEALIRWEHPDWGIISPLEFISIAEETGLIIDIGYWLIREVCRNYSKWIDEGMPKIKISVNISSIQFFENNFVQNVINILNEYNIAPNLLIVEITESVFLLKVNNVISQIEKLRSYGILVALDDFGTGFSSLEYFKHFNIDILKIDGSFIKSVISDETSKIITESMIDLAKKLKFKLVAEGIENHAQLNYLQELNCYAGQGYLFSKPLIVEEFEKVLSNKSCQPLINNKDTEAYEERRKFFRVDFPNLLEVNMTIKEFRGENLNIGNSKVLVKNISPAGLCFISNIKIPVNKEIILKFTTNIYKKELKLLGNLVWSYEIDNNLYEYGIKFNNGESQILMLTEKLNQIIRIQKTNMYDDMLISCSPNEYFK